LKYVFPRFTKVSPYTCPLLLGPSLSKASPPPITEPALVSVGAAGGRAARCERRPRGPGTAGLHLRVPGRRLLRPARRSIKERPNVEHRPVAPEWACRVNKESEKEELGRVFCIQSLVFPGSVGSYSYVLKNHPPLNKPSPPPPRTPLRDPQTRSKLAREYCKTL